MYNSSTMGSDGITIFTCPTCIYGTTWAQQFWVGIINSCTRLQVQCVYIHLVKSALGGRKTSKKKIFVFGLILQLKLLQKLPAQDSGSYYMCSVQIKWSSGCPDAQNCRRTTWTSQQVIRGMTRLTSPEVEFDFENIFHLFWSALTFKIDGFQH